MKESRMCITVVVNEMNVWERASAVRTTIPPWLTQDLYQVGENKRRIETGLGAIPVRTIQRPLAIKCSFSVPCAAGAKGDWDCGEAKEG